MRNTDKVSMEIILILITALITFLIGRWTSHLDDHRTGMKEIDKFFYKPFLSLYKNAHHAYAMNFVDIDFKVQEQLVKLLLDNVEIVSPRLRLRIFEQDQCFSGYSQNMEQGIEMLQDEIDYVEQHFGTIYSYIEKQYIKNERKLYCSGWNRMNYCIQEIVMWFHDTVKRLKYSPWCRSEKD